MLVIGDAMIDAYLWGTINRQSPEAPIPIVDIHSHEQRLGGAANVAVNLKSLGVTPILCSVVGSEKSEFFDLMNRHGLDSQGVLTEHRKTTTKTRVIAENKHQLRLDDEDNHPIIKEKAFIENTLALMKEVDAVIFQDYNKGILTPKVIETLISNAKQLKKYILVDPKKNNFWLYKGAHLFKPNLNELQEQCDISINIDNYELLNNTIEKIRKKLDAQHLLLTLSEHGMFIQNNQCNLLQPAFDRQIIDVSGAGDCVIATAACALASNLQTKEIISLSNLAGGLSCEKVGVNPIEKERLLKEAIRLI